MAKPYSFELREWVTAAVDRDGMSRQAAARRFGIGASYGDPLGEAFYRDRQLGAWADRRALREEDFWCASRVTGAALPAA